MVTVTSDYDIISVLETGSVRLSMQYLQYDTIQVLNIRLKADVSSQLIIPHDIEIKTEKGGNCECVATERPSVVAPVVLDCFLPNLYCARDRTAIYQFQIKILISASDSATHIS